MIQELLQKNEADDEEDGLINNPLRLYSAVRLDDLQQQRKLLEFYNPLPIDCCGFREDPQDKANIAAKKRSLNKPFVNEFQKDAVPELLALNDGMYQTNELEKFDTMNAYRLEKRLTRDSREEFYKANGQLIAQRDFYEDKVSRLANISFEANPAVAIYQKNATLSIRTNQNKNEPFQFEVVVGQLAFHQHPLMNEEQRQFELLRPLLEELQRYSTHPELPYLTKLAKELKYKHSQLSKKGARDEILDQLQMQIDKVNSRAEQERDDMQSTMKKVLEGWNMVKLKRKASGCVSVPWKVSVKEYKAEEQTQFEIGLTSTPTTTDIDLPPAERQRKQEMEKQVYFLRLVINDNEVSKTSKLRMNWPHFTLPIYEKFSMFLFTMPSSIKLEVVRNGIIETVIDSIGLKLPGEHAQTLTSAERRLISENFYENGDAVRKKKVQPFGHVGTITYKVEWKGEGPHMPPSNITISDEVSTQAETEVPEEQQNADVNDPRKLNKAKKAGGKKLVALTQRVSKEAVMPFEGLISTRQFLLKLRSKNNALSGKRIPLSEDAIRKRQDLMRIIELEKLANTMSHEPSAERTYNPLEGIFRYQPEQTQRRIREILTKFVNNRHAVNTGVVTTSYKYRLVDEIINEYTFEQMVSPIVVFFKDLFTQKRKLGPRKVHAPPTRDNITELQVEVHIASAVNVPARQSSNNVLGKYRKNREIMSRQIAQTIGLITGLSLFQQQPNIGSQSYGYYNNQTGGMQYANRGSMIGGVGGGGRMQPMIDYNNPTPATDNPHDLLSTIERVHTFVQLTHKQMNMATTQAEGVAPEWNETLSFTYNLKHEQSSLEHMFYSTGRKLMLNLFDIVEESRPTHAADEIRIKKTKFYLGSVEVPLSTLISLPKVSGTFRVRRPLMIFGYSTVHQPVLSSPDQQVEFRTENPSVGTYISLDLSVAPSIDNSLAYNGDKKFFGGEEDPLFLQHANDWLEQLNMKRYIRLWLNNLEGNSIFISRFLMDVEPPPLRSNQFPEKLIERTARFVSLIPQKSICKLLDNTEEFHMTSQQFLDAKMGDDHAILLCNYFNAIDRVDGKADWQSFLMVGKAFPEGKTMYVLRLDKSTLDFEIWNPRTGEPYSFDKEQFETVCCCFTVSRGLKSNSINKDVCPLMEVSCLVSKDNVYVNIQPSVNPSEIRYDLNNSKLWKPFLTERSKRELFDRRPLKPYQGIPITKAFYELGRNTHSKEIDQEIYDEIYRNFQHKRKNFPRPCTLRLNQQISNMIKDRVLLQLENLVSDFRLTGTESAFYSSRQKSQWPSVLQQLERLKSQVKDQIDTDRTFYGFPLNMPFTTVQDAWHQVENTQIHLNQKEDLEFVMTVRTFDYPCFVTSVWVFLGVIE